MPESDPLIGQRVSNYEITRRLGQGGMGVVYQARHVTLEREVAIKFLAGQLSTNPDYVERFLREARAAARLNHPNIISVYDAGSEDDVYYFVMEFVEGRDLSQLLKQRKRFSESEAIGYTLKAAGALAYAHKANIAHRDIKPENLILAKDGELKVGDLGLAKQLNDPNSSVTMSGVVMGTPFYISPEQIRGAKEVDARTDIYSLGATLYHMATGQVPYRGNSAAEIMSKHLTEAFPWPQAVNAELGEGICRVIYKMMAKDVDERFQSMDEVGQVLTQLLGGNLSQVAAAIDVSESGIAAHPNFAATQMAAMPTALGATGPAPQAAPSVYPGQSVAGQSIAGQQPSIYTIPPTAVATRLGGIIGVSVVLGCILIGGVIWFTLGKKDSGGSGAQPKLNLEESAKRLGFLEEMGENKNQVAKQIEKKETPELPSATDKAPLLPPPPADPPAPSATSIAPVEPTPPAAKAEEKPMELALAKPTQPAIPAAPGPKVLLESDFEADVVHSLPKDWKPYIQETVAKHEKSKEAYWATMTSHETTDGTKAAWEISKTSEAFDGSQVFRITAMPPPDQKLKYRAGLTRQFPVEANRKYLLMFQARSGKDPVKGSLRYGAKGAVRDMTLDLNDEWKEVKTQFEAASSGDVGISIVLTTPGEMWIDGVKVIQKD